MENKGFEPDLKFPSREGITSRKNGDIIFNDNTKRSHSHDLNISYALDMEDKVGFKRNVGLLSGISMIVGTMIGSGIFVTPGGLLEKTGSVWLSLIIWTVCGLLSTFGAISYIELGTVVPSSGGEYAYMLKAFGPIPGFLFAWTSTIVLKPSSVAIISLAFAQYTVDPFVEDLTCHYWTTIMVAVAAILIITVINCISVQIATNVQNILTLAKLIAVAIIVGGGIYNILNGKVEHLQKGFEGSKWNFGTIASAFYSGLWAYDGWNSLNYITEEIKNPYRNLPLALSISMPLVTGCYLLVNIAFLTLMSPEEIISSSAVAIVYGNRLLGVMAFLMPLSVALSTFGAANGTHFAAGRLCYAAATQGHLVDCLSYIHVTRNVPTLALIFNGVVALLMAVVLPIEQLIDFFGFTAWIFYGATAGALIRLRFTMPDAPRPFKVWIFMPTVVLLMSIFLVVAPIVEDPKLEYLYASAFIISGLILYVPFVHFKCILPGMESLTVFLQKLFLVVPPDSDPDLVSAQTSQDVNSKKEKPI